jgi:hypothetical protein
MDLSRIYWEHLFLTKEDIEDKGRRKELSELVDETGVEPATSSLRTMRSPS